MEKEEEEQKREERERGGEDDWSVRMFFRFGRVHLGSEC